MRRRPSPFRRLERGSWVTTDLMDALRGFPPEVVVLFLYVRALAGLSKYLPTVKRLAKVTGSPAGEVELLYDAAARAGLWTDQWLGCRNLFRSGRRAYVTIRALNELKDRGVSPEEIVVLVRYLPYVDTDGKLRVSKQAISERARLPRGVVTEAFGRFSEAEIIGQDGRFAEYLR